MGPIKPEEVIERKKETIPDEVFEAFNELIVKYCADGVSRFTQSEVIEAIVKKKPADLIDIDSLEEAYDIIFKKRWLNIEELYMEVGWVVEYDHRGLGDSRFVNFTFTKPLR
jgi:hypothetical protein